eukprot:CAMPEP_0185813820 /NCGR_PEP_ID=MMETSP1322-20130828/12461_1 /TAXON_ID=265543 /ORGANISM="Minutocellus polymorphus, Strain RCC2270" /LENGTH=461 /DNA_ID=CAMNT_0028510521 /DNA_START=60 /DNA_END=1445 /DNA_ORIENTATION=-
MSRISSPDAAVDPDGLPTLTKEEVDKIHENIEDDNDFILGLDFEETAIIAYNDLPDFLKTDRAVGGDETADNLYCWAGCYFDARLDPYRKKLLAFSLIWETLKAKIPTFEHLLVHYAPKTRGRANTVRGLTYAIEKDSRVWRLIYYILLKCGLKAEEVSKDAVELFRKGSPAPGLPTLLNAFGNFAILVCFHGNEVAAFETLDNLGCLFGLKKVLQLKYALAVRENFSSWKLNELQKNLIIDVRANKVVRRMIFRDGLPDDDDDDADGGTESGDESKDEDDSEDEDEDGDFADETKAYLNSLACERAVNDRAKKILADMGLSVSDALQEGDTIAGGVVVVRRGCVKHEYRFGRMKMVGKKMRSIDNDGQVVWYTERCGELWDNEIRAGMESLLKCKYIGPRSKTAANAWYNGAFVYPAHKGGALLVANGDSWEIIFDKDGREDDKLKGARFSMGLPCIGTN